MDRKNVGAIGIGAMIVFIAMVLVAGIAASVLIQTSSRLETQALATGSETTEEVAGGIAIDDIAGHVDTDIDMLAITVRVRAGSPDIDLNHTIIELSNGSKKVILSYDYADAHHFNSSIDSDADLFGTGNISDLTNEEFGIIVLSDPDSSLSRYTPVINHGDKVVLTVDTDACFSKLGERTDVLGMVIPEIGAPGMISFTTPSSYSDTVYDLQ
ncbi:MAG TPA: flagellin [Thermoplasmatales archaeon]|nr:flagellin [Thermoplasmatales archaeon]